MRTFGKIIFSILALFIGVQVFGFLNSVGTNKAIAKLADEAVVNEDYTFFNSIFDYYKEEILLDVEENGYKLKLFNVASSKSNIIIFLVEGVDKETVGAELIINVLLNGEQEAGDGDLKPHALAIGEENWHLQWLYLDNLYPKQEELEDIYQIKITDLKGETVIFDLSGDPLIKVSEFDIISHVEAKDYESNGIIKVEKRANLRLYSWYSWVGVLAYLLIIGVITYFIYFRKPKRRAKFESTTTINKDQQVKDATFKEIPNEEDSN